MTDAFSRIGNFNDNLSFFQPEGIALEDVDYPYPELKSLRQEFKKLMVRVDNDDYDCEECDSSDPDYSPSAESQQEFEEDLLDDLEEATPEELEIDAQKGHKLISEGDCSKKAVIQYTINHLYDYFANIIEKSTMRYEEMQSKNQLQTFIKRVIDVEIPKFLNKGAWAFQFPKEQFEDK